MRAHVDEDLSLGERSFYVLTIESVVTPVVVHDTPPILEPEAFEERRGDSHSITAVIAHLIPNRIEAGIRVLGLLHEYHVMAEVAEPDQVLQHVRHHAAKWVPDEVRTEHDSCHVTNRVRRRR